MDLIVIFCILFVFMLVLYCFCVATEFSVNKDLYINVFTYLLTFNKKIHFFWNGTTKRLHYTSNYTSGSIKLYSLVPKVHGCEQIAQ